MRNKLKASDVRRLRIVDPNAEISIQAFDRQAGFRVQTLPAGPVAAQVVPNRIVLKRTVNDAVVPHISCGTHEIMSVKLGTNDLLATLLREGRIFLVENCLFLKIEKDKFIDLNTSEETILTKEALKELVRNGEAKVYYTFAASSAEQRTGAILLLTGDKKNPLNRAAAKRKKVQWFNTIGSNSFQVLSEVYTGVDLPFGKLAKLASRQTLPITSGGKAAEMHNLVVYVGDITCNIDSSGKDVPFSDGFFSVSVEFEQRSLRERGIVVPAESLLYLNSQKRGLGTVKGYGEVVTLLNMSEKIKRHAHKEKPLILCSKEHGCFVGSKDCQISYEEVLSGMQLGKFDQSLVVFVKQPRNWEKLLAAFENRDVLGIVVYGAIEGFFDNTTMKAVTDFLGVYGEPAPFIDMEVSHEWRPYAKLNNQIIGSFQQIAFPEVAKAFAKIAYENLKEIFKFERLFSKPEDVKEDAEDIIDDVDSSNEDEDEITKGSIKSLGNEGYIRDFLFSYAQDFVKRDKTLFTKMIEAMVKESYKMCHDLNFKVDGTYGKIVPDPGNDFGIILIKEGEVFMPGWKPGARRGVLVRNPKTAAGEVYLITKFLSRQELLKRIDKALSKKSITLKQAKVLRKKVRLAKEGNIAVPSWLAKLTALLAGHDYDGDGATLVDSKGLLGRLVVNLFFEHIKPMAIPYGPAESKNSEKYRFDIDAMDKAYLYAVENPNEPIGKLVIAAYKFGGIAVAVEQGQLTQSLWETLLANNIKRFFIDSNGDDIPEFSNSTDLYRANVVVDNGEYVPFFKEGEEIPVITNRVIREFTYHIYKYGIKNVNNLKMVCKELQIIYSPVVGKTIDSTKSPDDVHAPLIWLANMFGGSVKTNLDYKQENGRFSCWTSKPGLSCWTKKGLDGEEETFVSFNINDIFFQLYSFSAYAIENMANELLETGALGFSVPNYSNAPQSAKDYADCVKHISEMFSGIQKFDSEQTARLKPLFVNAVRSMTSDLDYRSRAAIIKMATHKGEGEFFGTRELFGIELLHNSGVENVVATEKLYGYDMDTEFEEGQIITLVKGRGENCFTKAPITGEFKVAFEYKSDDDDSDPVVVVKTSVYEYMESFDDHRDIVMFKLNLSKNDDAEGVANLLAQLSMSDDVKFVTTANAVHKNKLHVYLGQAHKEIPIFTPKPTDGGQIGNNIFEKHLDLKEINVVDVVYYEDGKGKPCVVVVGEIIRSVTDPMMALY